MSRSWRADREETTRVRRRLAPPPLDPGLAPFLISVALVVLVVGAAILLTSP